MSIYASYFFFEQALVRPLGNQLNIGSSPSRNTDEYKIQKRTATIGENRLFILKESSLKGDALPKDMQVFIQRRHFLCSFGLEMQQEKYRL